MTTNLCAVNHSQKLMEDLKGPYYKNWEQPTIDAAAVGVA